MQCKALSKRSRQQCRRHATPGFHVCAMHGGKSRIGPGSATYKHGRYSRFLPSRLFAHAEAAAKDPQLLELREAIAVVDARIIDILKRVDTGEAGSVWRKAQAAMAKLRTEQAKGNIDAMQLAIAQVDRLISQGAADYAAWGEIADLIERRRRLVESEARRLREAHESLTAEQAMALLAQVVATIQRHVTDRQVLAAIALEFQALGHRNGHGHGPRDESPGCMP